MHLAPPAGFEACQLVIEKTHQTLPTPESLCKLLDALAPKRIEKNQENAELNCGSWEYISFYSQFENPSFLWDRLSYQWAWASECTDLDLHWGARIQRMPEMAENRNGIYQQKLRSFSNCFDRCQEWVDWMPMISTGAMEPLTTRTCKLLGCFLVFLFIFFSTVLVIVNRFSFRNVLYVPFILNVITFHNIHGVLIISCRSFPLFFSIPPMSFSHGSSVSIFVEKSFLVSFPG